MQERTRDESVEGDSKWICPKCDKNADETDHECGKNLTGIDDDNVWCKICGKLVDYNADPEETPSLDLPSEWFTERETF